jgi:hypothetical protein
MRAERSGGSKTLKRGSRRGLTVENGIYRKCGVWPFLVYSEVGIATLYRDITI